MRSECLYWLYAACRATPQSLMEVDHYRILQYWVVIASQILSETDIQMAKASRKYHRIGQVMEDRDAGAIWLLRNHSERGVLHSLKGKKCVVWPCLRQGEYGV